MNLKDKLNEQNAALLDEIEKIFPVEFEKWDKQYWGAKIKKNPNIGIIYHPTTFSDAKVAHELLHLKIGSIMGDNQTLLEYPKKLQNKMVENLFNHKVVEHFLNSYEHMKMFSLYKSMGFDDKDFFEDTISSSMSEFSEYIKKKGLVQGNSYCLRILIRYISSVISCLSFPIDARWNKELKNFKHADKILYDIIQKYWKGILQLPLSYECKKDMENKHIEFIDNINNWMSNKKISY